MSEYVDAGELVEGARCNIYTRKEEWKSMQKDPITHKSMTKYELSRNCSVEVVEKYMLSLPEDMELRKELPLHSEAGDKLKALCITVYIDQKKKLGEPEIDKSTGRHEGRLFYTDKRTIGVIKYPFENLKAITKKYIEEKQKQLTDKIEE